MGMFKKAVRFATNEVTLWTLGLIALFLAGDMPGPSICLFKWMGIERCWGCGLGHALHDALHLDLAGSFAHHPLGIPVLAVILGRVIGLARRSIQPPIPPTWTRKTC